MTPTVNVVIDDDKTIVEEKQDDKTIAPKPCFTPHDTVEVFKIVGMSFGVGMLVGGMLVFAFSKAEAA